MFKAFSYSQINLSSTLLLLVGCMFPFPLCIACITAHKCGFRRGQELFLQRFSISSGLHQPRTTTVTERHHRMSSCSRHSEAPLQCCRQGPCYRRLLQFLLSAALILPSISAGNSLATSAFSLSCLSYHPKPYPWPPGIAQHISLLLTSDSFQNCLEFPKVSACKQLKLDLGGEESEVARLLQSHEPPPLFRRQAGASGSRERRLGAAGEGRSCAAVPEPPADTWRRQREEQGEPRSSLSSRPRIPQGATTAGTAHRRTAQPACLTVSYTPWNSFETPDLDSALPRAAVDAKYRGCSFPVQGFSRSGPAASPHQHSALHTLHSARCLSVYSSSCHFVCHANTNGRSLKNN